MSQEEMCCPKKEYPQFREPDSFPVTTLCAKRVTMADKVNVYDKEEISFSRALTVNYS